MKQLIECVPNFSEGSDMAVIKQITDVIETVDGVKLLNVDPGKATNRTVVTFVGTPDEVIEAAFLAIKKASELIDMSKHTGEHPRMGATDVCPLVPIANIEMDEVVEYAHKLGERVGRELGIPGYFYENAATSNERKNLAVVRKGEYEALKSKLVDPEWKPDFGPAEFVKAVNSGATAISARDFLIAYNVNLNTTSPRRANAVAYDIREKGRIKREGETLSGAIVKDSQGSTLWTPGKLKHVKAIGWYIEEYGVTQVTMNITNIKETPLHKAFYETALAADARGIRATGSELVGLVPKSALIDAGKFFLKKQDRSTGIHESEIIKIAIKSMGLDELSPFIPEERIIEYMLAGDDTKLIDLSLSAFADETASESPAPGGGSIAAYVGSLGISLATMVANLSAHKRGWDERWEEFSNWAEQGQILKDELLFLVDEDTNSFNKIMEAMRLPKGSDSEKQTRKEAMDAATKYAILTPFRVMETSLKSMDIIQEMAEIGNPNSVTDAGVGALCARTAVIGAFLNVKINCKDFDDTEFVTDILAKGEAVMAKAIAKEEAILKITMDKI
ncbi:MAG: glutamate formimidoyltransferase [Flavobacteriales bacterium]|jgi:glutamate formiminotransferase/formiminotetrahydrofolate cyclodeaminase